MLGLSKYAGQVGGLGQGEALMPSLSKYAGRWSGFQCRPLFNARRRRG